MLVNAAYLLSAFKYLGATIRAVFSNNLLLDNTFVILARISKYSFEFLPILTNLLKSIALIKGNVLAPYTDNNLCTLSTNTWMFAFSVSQSTSLRSIGVSVILSFSRIVLTNSPLLYFKIFNE